MVISLTSTLINSHYNIPRSLYHFKRRERLWEPALIIGVILLLGLTLGPLYCSLLNTMYDQYEASGLRSLFLAGPFLIANLFGFIFGVFLMISTFFFGDDMRVLIPLPLKSTEVLMSKFLVVLMDLMLISLAIILPAYILYGVRSSAGIGYWIFMVIVFLLSQVLPIMLSAIIVLPLSRLFRFRRHRDNMVYLLSALILVGVLIFISITSRVDPNMSAEEFAKIFSSEDAILNKTAGAYPPTILVTKALSRPFFEGLLWLLAFIGLHVVALGVFLFFGDKFYYSVYSSLQENFAKRTALKEGEITDLMGIQNSKFAALHRREWWYFLKVPAFAFNGFGNVLVFPILLVIAAVAGQTDQLGQMLDQFQQYKPLFVPVGALVAAVAGGINGLASSMFSREGDLIRELKALPVDVNEIVKVKFLHIETLSLIGPAFGAVALSLILGLSFVEALVVFAVGALTLTFLNILQMIIDSIKPILEWENPQRAMKQNVNVALSIPVVFGYVGGLGYLAFLLKDTISGTIMTIILTAIALVGIVVTWPVLMKRANRLFARDL
jgi:ABC-2 type transport system permease protein